MKWADSAAAAAMIEILESEPWEFQQMPVHSTEVAGTDREPDPAAPVRRAAGIESPAINGHQNRIRAPLSRRTSAAMPSMNPPPMRSNVAT